MQTSEFFRLTDLLCLDVCKCLAPPAEDVTGCSVLCQQGLTAPDGCSQKGERVRKTTPFGGAFGRPPPFCSQACGENV